MKPILLGKMAPAPDKGADPIFEPRAAESAPARESAPESLSRLSDEVGGELDAAAIGEVEGDLQAALERQKALRLEKIRLKVKLNEPLTAAETKLAESLVTKRAAGEFDPGAVARKLNLHWRDGGGDTGFFIKLDEHWRQLPGTRVKEYLRGAGLSDFAIGGEPLSRISQVMEWVERNHAVETVMEGIAGWGSGVQIMGGSRVLVKKGPRLMEAKEGEFPLISKFLERLLVPVHDGDKATRFERSRVQLDRFLGWLQRAVVNIYDAEDIILPGHILALAGDAGCGKSFLQNNLITPLLGGEDADPQPWLHGDESFNADLVRAPHLKIEEPQTAHKRSDKEEMARRLKMLAANEDTRLRAMYAPGMQVRPKWRVTMSYNREPDAVRMFPPLVPGFVDKVLFFLLQSQPMPMPGMTVEDRRNFLAAWRAELPALLFYLRKQYQVPRALASGRWGVTEFCDPTIKLLLLENDPSGEFLAIIDGTELTLSREAGAERRGTIWSTANGYTAEDAIAKFGGSWNPDKRGASEAAKVCRHLAETAKLTGRRIWVGHVAELEEQLQHPSASLVQAAKKRVGPAFVARMLGTLARDVVPDRVAGFHVSGGARWMIVEP